MRAPSILRVRQKREYCRQTSERKSDTVPFGGSLRRLRQIRPSESMLGWYTGVKNLQESC